MTTIFGAVRWHRDDPGAADDAAVLARALAHRPGPVRVQRFGRAVLGGSLLGEADGLAIAADAPRCPTIGDAHALLVGAGDEHAITAWDERSSTLTLTRDVFGVRPLYWARHDAGLAFASEAAALLDLSWVDDTLDDHRLAMHLAQWLTVGDRTFHVGVKRVEPRTTLRITQSGAHRSTTWEPDLETTWRAPDAAYEDAHRALLTEAVDRRLGDGVVVGAQLSGGLDSGATTLLAARALRSSRRRLVTVSYDAGPGEREHAGVEAVLAAEPSIEGHRLSEDSGWQIGALPIHRDMPIYPPLGLAQGRECALFAGLGVRDVLSGWGGDQGATGCPGWFAELATHWRLPLIVDEISAHGAARTARQLATGVLDLQLARSLRLPTPKGVGAARDRRVRAVVDPDWARASGLDDLLSRGRSRVRGTVRATLAHRLFVEDSVAQRCERSDRMAAAAGGFSYRYPYLDVALVELALSLPLGQRRQRGVGRSLHRRAMTGIVPAVVLDAPKRPPGNRGVGARLEARRAANQVAFARLVGERDVAALQRRFRLDGPVAPPADLVRFVLASDPHGSRPSALPT